MPGLVGGVILMATLIEASVRRLFIVEITLVVRFSPWYVFLRYV